MVAQSLADCYQLPPSLVRPIGMASFALRTKAELSCFLDELTVTNEAIMLGEEKIDTTAVYEANCKECPARHLIVLPGFSQEALLYNSESALERFKNFCRSQLGQRQRAGGALRIIFSDPPARQILTITKYFPMDEILQTRTMAGNEKIFNADADAKLEDLGVASDVFVTDDGQLVQKGRFLLDFAEKLVVLANFNCVEVCVDDWYYGEEYLTLHKGDELIPLNAPTDIDACGWKYGTAKGRRGWFPPQYV